MASGWRFVVARRRILDGQWCKLKPEFSWQMDGSESGSARASVACYAVIAGVGLISSFSKAPMMMIGRLVDAFLAISKGQHDDLAGRRINPGRVDFNSRRGKLDGGSDERRRIQQAYHELLAC